MGPHRSRRAGAQQGRQQMMRSLAEAHGWSWQEWTTTLNRRWVNAPFTARGARATNVVSGSLRGYPVLAFDYAYQVSSLDPTEQRWSTTTYDWSVCVVRLPGVVPVLRIIRRGWLGRMAATVLPTGGWAPGGAFRRHFQVWAADRDAARAVLPTRTRRLMVDSGLSYLFEGADLLCWTPAGQSAQQVLARLGVLVEIADAVPATVWRPAG
jgi:hypothetical protein